MSGNGTGSLSYVPIKGGLRHYLLTGKLLFLQAEAGVGSIKNEVVSRKQFRGDLGRGLFEVLPAMTALLDPEMKLPGIHPG